MPPITGSLLQLNLHEVTGLPIHSRNDVDHACSGQTARKLYDHLVKAFVLALCADVYYWDTLAPNGDAHLLQGTATPTTSPKHHQVSLVRRIAHVDRYRGTFPASR